MHLHQLPLLPKLLILVIVEVHGWVLTDKHFRGLDKSLLWLVDEYRLRRAHKYVKLIFSLRVFSPVFGKRAFRLLLQIIIIGLHNYT